MHMIQTMPHSIGDEIKDHHDHLNVFREFIDHLDRAARQRLQTQIMKNEKNNTKR
jgi:hypothetical protein